MRGAMDLFIAEAHGRPAAPLPVGPRLAALSQGLSGASWVMAIERSMDEWFRTGSQDDARQALDQLDTTRHTPQTTDFGRASLDLMRARFAGGEGRINEAGALARVARAAFRAIPAPWWTAKTLGVLAEIGLATAAEGGELASLRQRLGLA